MKHSSWVSIARVAGLCVAGLALALLSACGGGGKAADPVPDDALFVGGGALQAGAPSQTVCGGTFAPGSSRWCDLGDGTIKDMTTNFVYLKNVDCWGELTKSDANQKVALLGNGQCGLTDGSVPGDWGIPDADVLRVLRVGPEALSLENHNRGFSGLFGNYYWSSTSFLGVAFIGVGILQNAEAAFAAKQQVEIGGSLPDGSIFVLPVKYWTPISGVGNMGVTRGIAMVPGHAPAKYLTANRWLIAANSTYVVLWDWDSGSTDNRFWYFEPDGTGYYRIFDKVGIEAWRYLAVYADRRDAGVDVIAFPDRGGDNHLWKPIQQAGWPAHVFAFQSKSSGMCLDIREGGTSNGSALVQYPCDSSKGSQRWALWFR